MSLYSFTDQRDPDRILNRLKRLDAQVQRLRGGVETKSNSHTRLAKINEEMARRARAMPTVVSQPKKD